MKIIIPIAIILTTFSSAVYADYYSQARSSFVYKKYDRAKELFLKAAETSKSGNSYYFLGEIEKLQGNFTEAEKYYRLATERPTTRKYLVNSYWNLVVLSEQRGDTQSLARTSKNMWRRLRDNSAREKVEKLINRLLWTDNPEAIEKYTTAINLKRSDPEKALSILREAAGMDRDFLAPRFEIALILSSSGKDSQASSYFKEVVDKVPIHAAAHIALADSLINMGRYSEAVPHLEKALEFGFLDSKTESILHTKLCRAYYAVNSYDRALEHSSRAHSLDRSNIDPLLIESAVYIKQRDYDNAIKTLQTASAIKPNDPGCLLQLGSIYYSQGDDKYIEIFNRLFNKIAKSETGVRRSYYTALNILARASFDKKSYTRSEEIADNLIEIKPANELLLISAKSSFYLKKYTKAEKTFSLITSMSNQDRYLHALACARSDMVEKAGRILTPILYDSSIKEKAEKEKDFIAVMQEYRKSLEPTKQAESEKLITDKSEQKNETHEIEDETSEEIKNKTQIKPEAKLLKPEPATNDDGNTQHGKDILPQDNAQQ